jgi:ATP-binding cassette subfamily F protein uup
MLQDMLADYQGTVLLVSHDRDFLDRVVTSTIASEGDGRWVEYAGGYSDMLAQRGESAAPATAKSSRSRAPLAQTSAARPAAKKLSFKDLHALKTLPGEMETLQARIAGHQAVLSDAGLFARDEKRFHAVSAALTADSAALAAAEERWLHLELLREASET